VDVNLAHRNDLASASAAYVRGGEEREAWDRIGDLGEAFGLRWLGHGDPGEIFHFEWHPTWPGRPKGALLGRLNATQRKEGLPGVWKLLRREAGKTAFEHLEDR
jgi:hypothetical protein